MMTFLRWAEPSLGITVLSVLLCRGWARRLPWFAAWIGLTALCSIGTLFVPFPSRLYNAVAACSIPLLVLLELLAILRCAQEVLRGYSLPSQQRRIASAIYTVGLSLALIVVLAGLGELCPQPQWIQSCVLAWRIVSWMGAAVLFLISLCANYLPARLPAFINWHRSILCVRCASEGVSLEFSVLHNARLSLLGAYCYEVALITCYAIWVYALVRCPRPVYGQLPMAPPTDDPILVRYRRTMDRIEEGQALLQ